LYWFKNKKRKFLFCGSAKKLSKRLKILFQTHLERLFAGAPTTASHRHRIARVPWELHEPRLLLLTVVITHRRSQIAIPSSCSPALALTRLFYFMPLLRPASVSHIRSDDTKRGGSDQEVRTRKKFARRYEPNAN
jgi:hypothetical protein